MSIKTTLACWCIWLALPLISPSQKLTLDEAVLQQFTTFAPQSLAQLQWMPGTSQYSYVKDSAVWTGTYKASEKKLFALAELNNWCQSQLKSIPTLRWTAADRFYFEHEGRYLFVNTAIKKLERSVAIPKEAANTDLHASTGQLAYTVDNNLWVLINGQSKAVTQNEKHIVSGQSISRVEYGISKGTFWNPQGSHLAYYEKDEINVTDYPLTDYKTTPATVKWVKYPMAGAPSEMVSVGVYEVASGKKVYLDLNKNDQFYATNLAWSPDGRTIYLALLNRATNKMELNSYEAATGLKLQTLFTESSNTYLEPEHPVVFLPGASGKFIWMSERNGFNNLYLYTSNGTLLANTQADFEITELLGFDRAGKWAYVMATGAVPTESHCYRVNLADMKMQKLTAEQGVHNVQVDDSGQWMLDQYSSLGMPGRTGLCSVDLKKKRTLLQSPDPLAARTIGRTEIFTLRSGGDELYCRLIKPHDFDPAKKYPVVVYLYNGPHVQLVQNNYLGGASLWMHYLAEKGYLVFTLDGHGSAHRGKKFEEVIYRQLGTREMEDQLAGVEWLKKQPWVDASRMAVHGWSFGGFMTTTLMLRAPGTFKVGVAGGPVIDWRLYEVMYTERYMDTPEENPDGYKTADLTNYVSNLKGDLLLIHGTDDETVVMQHVMRLLDACVKNKVQVDFFAYPGHAHNVRGRDRVHLIAKIIEYIEEKL